MSNQNSSACACSAAPKLIFACSVTADMGAEIIDLTPERSRTAREEAAATVREAPATYKSAASGKTTVRERKA